jgi:hypothetical protein
MSNERRHNLSLATLEQCVAIAAYAVAVHGRPDGEMQRVFEAMQHELELARQDDPVVKARRVLDAYTREGGLNAIFSKIDDMKAKV